ncbi:glutathione peroxidase [Alkalicoccobacillus gibsonii]|jgi:glutathione peroxidase|uniref:Glutathione peroxidase n=1 Tax=Alkalicoccobacillus gibsonii TaxID=79881 RepID=A0ABU9VFS3_9BACI|nr:glutathione peroxidase [Alkalicoccobacillus gibsonii]MBM0067405.1 glutathione peroxidase [Alkalicoccobacillus gibsonii]
MSVYDYTVKSSKGEDIPLSKYEGKALLIVNTATKCGFAPQFDGLEKLHQEYADQGFEVLGFPCNQFMNQEPVEDDEMENVCKVNFGVSFPLFAKVDVNGSNAHPLYQHLKKEKKGTIGSDVKWNFTKFLVNQEGEVIERFAPTTKPEKIEPEIKKLLK